MIVAYIFMIMNSCLGFDFDQADNLMNLLDVQYNIQSYVICYQTDSFDLDKILRFNDGNLYIYNFAETPKNWKYPSMGAAVYDEKSGYVVDNFKLYNFRPLSHELVHLVLHERGYSRGCYSDQAHIQINDVVRENGIAIQRLPRCIV